MQCMGKKTQKTRCAPSLVSNSNVCFPRAKVSHPIQITELWQSEQIICPPPEGRKKKKKKKDLSHIEKKEQ